MKLHASFFSLIFCALFLSTSVVRGQVRPVDRGVETKPALLILGTYHMGTPGNNLVNPKVADITTPERQRQLLELTKRLENFRPSKIVLECDSDAEAKTQGAYDKFLTGNYQLSKNETDQIGFRLAKELGHRQVYCVDWSDFWDDPSINYQKYAAQDAELDAYLKHWQATLKNEIDSDYEKLLPLSIIDQLAYVNRPDQLAKDHRRYFDLMRIGRGKEYVGTNYVSWWYRRNLTILTNIIRLTDSPHDRILVVYGVGHAKLLTQFAEESGFYQVEGPLKYLKSKR